MYKADYKMMGYQRADLLGKYTHYNGVKRIDGIWYVAGMPRPLANAGKDFYDWKIGEQLLIARIESRKPYELCLKTVTKSGKCVYYIPAT